MILITSANLRWSKRRSKARSASGGIVYGGEADGSTSDVLQRSASGGVVYGGSANGVIESVFRSASGGVVYGGTATAQLAVVWREACGGIVYGGAAALSEVTVIRSASGGITYGGEAFRALPVTSPSEVADLKLWYDATDNGTMFDAVSGGSVVDIGDTVGRWENKGVGGFNLTQFSGDPSYTGDSVLFDTVSQIKMLGGLMLSSSTGATWVIVAKRRASSTNFVISENTNASVLSITLTSSNVQFKANPLKSTSAPSIISTSSGSGAYECISCVWDIPEGEFFTAINSLVTAASTTTTRTNVSSSVSMTMETVGSNRNGEIKEALFWPRKLTNPERSSIEQYLINKHGL